mmetsp:Transcript_18874/g.36455  ORF Transcript_18874/g.36455 Transcript_18874/m.36455 type:complete len:223 (-) Transcript_18874:4520-5188(-)
MQHSHKVEHGVVRGTFLAVPGRRAGATRFALGYLAAVFLEENAPLLRALDSAHHAEHVLHLVGGCASGAIPFRGDVNLLLRVTLALFAILLAVTLLLPQKRLLLGSRLAVEDADDLNQLAHREEIEEVELLTGFFHCLGPREHLLVEVPEGLVEGRESLGAQLELHGVSLLEKEMSSLVEAVDLVFDVEGHVQLVQERGDEGRHLKLFLEPFRDLRHDELGA